MNEHEKYLFDLRGYIVVRNAITTAQIDDLSNAVGDASYGEKLHSWVRSHRVEYKRGSCLERLIIAGLGWMLY